MTPIHTEPKCPISTGHLGPLLIVKFQGDFLQNLKEYFQFRKFLMPVALQLLFWCGIAGTLYGTWWLYTHDNWAWIMSLLFGPILVRLIFEGFIIRYQTYLRLTEIRNKLYEDN